MTSDATARPLLSTNKAYDPQLSEDMSDTSSITLGPDAPKTLGILPPEYAWIPGFEQVERAYLWLARLRKDFGIELLAMIFCSQHLIKGAAAEVTYRASPYLWAEYNVPSSVAMTYKATTMLPFALKSLMGIVSDMFPVFGFQKAPYLVAVACIGIPAYAVLGTVWDLDIGLVVLCLFLARTQEATSDLLVEAKYSSAIHENPAAGPNLIAFVNMGMTIGQLVITAMYSTLRYYFGLHQLFLLSALLCSPILVPTCLNYLKELRLTRQEMKMVREKMMGQTEVLIAAVLIAVVALTVTFLELWITSPDLRLFIALLVCGAFMVAINILLRPEIAHIMSFEMMRTASSISISQATFLFYTDGPAEYPDGPHFSAFFYNTVLGAVTLVSMLVGMVVYARVFQYWRYRPLLTMTFVFYTLLNIPDMILFSRFNVAVGIPDSVFVLGASCMQNVVNQWGSMPMFLLISKVCPVGMESTIFALLASSANVGISMSNYIGSWLLSHMNVNPQGVPDEGAAFDNLWFVSMLIGLAPLFLIPIVPLLLPDAKQTEDMIVHNRHSATAGSRLQKWRGEVEAERTVPATEMHQHADDVL